MVDNPFGTNISFLVSSQIPDHIRSDNELYDLFMTAYYEWLELENNPLYMSEHLTEFTDIDKTPDYFFNQLKNEILANFPQNTLADKSLLLRFAKDFYERKGTLASYKFLFKALYNEDIEISLPKDYILRASDGQWVVDNYILCQAIKGDPFTLIGDYIYNENGTALFVDNVVMHNEGRYEVYKIYLPNSTVNLEIEEQLKNKDKSVIISTLGVLKDIEVISSGNNYQVGDYVPIRDPYGINGVARIKSLKPTYSISGFKILNGGQNYRVGDQLVFTAENGFGAVAYVSKINNISANNQCITTIESEQNVVTDDVDNIVVEDYVKYQQYEIGSIAEITLVDGGRDYDELPTISINQESIYGLPNGSGANIIAVSKNFGQITKIEVVDRGIGYKKSDIYPIIDLSELGDGTARAKATVYAGVIQSGGYWKDNRGKLDSTVYLQDNYYYQNFSYVIKSSQPLNAYKNIVLENVHLSGAQLFGEVCINENVVQYGNAPYYYNQDQWIKVNIDVNKDVSVSGDQWIRVNIDREENYADLYGTIYYIRDFANYTPSLYQDVALEDFAAIYQDLLLWDLDPIRLDSIWYTPLYELYGTTRNSAYFAQPCDVEVTKLRQEAA